MRWANRELSSTHQVFASVRKNPWPAVLTVAVLIGTALQLHYQGRAWWCSCRSFLWTASAWSSQTSQSFLDPYSFTHLLHGFAFAGLLLLMTACRRLASLRSSLLLNFLGSERNSVRSNDTRSTGALGYQETSAEFMGDIFCCGIGLIIARV